MDKPGENGSAESSPGTSAKAVETLLLTTAAAPPPKPKVVVLDKSVPKRGEDAARPLAVSHSRDAMYTSGTASCKRHTISTFIHQTATRLNDI